MRHLRTQRKQIRQRLLEQQHGRCAYCKCALTAKEATLDHIRPLSSGGSGLSKLQNLRVVCRPCNQRKADGTLTELYNFLDGQQRC